MCICAVADCRYVGDSKYGHWSYSALPNGNAAGCGAAYGSINILSTNLRAGTYHRSARNDSTALWRYSYAGNPLSSASPYRQRLCDGCYYGNSPRARYIR